MLFNENKNTDDQTQAADQITTAEKWQLVGVLMVITFLFALLVPQAIGRTHSFDAAADFMFALGTTLGVFLVAGAAAFFAASRTPRWHLVFGAVWVLVTAIQLLRAFVG